MVCINKKQYLEETIEKYSNMVYRLAMARTGNSEEAQEPITFESKIDSTDLNNYKRTQEYVPGKKNPFAATSTATSTATTGNSTTENGNQTTGNTTNSSNSGSTSGNSQTNNQENNSGYFQDKGTK